MKYQTRKIAIALGLALSSAWSYATVISQGSVEWSFGTAPTSTYYMYSSNYFGFIAQLNNSSYTSQQYAYLASNYSGDLSFSNSSLSAKWDPLTGNSYGTLQAISSTPFTNDNHVLYSAATWFNIYTDILNFSYTYQFSGSKDSVSDIQGYAVQTAVINANDEVLYSDYDPRVENFRTNWVYIPDTDLLTNEVGTRNFSFGTAGNYQNWYVRADVAMVGQDFSGPRTNVPEPSTLFLAISGLLACVGFRRFKKQ